MHARVQESWAKLMPLQILQGGIQPWAPAGGGGARVGAQSAPPPLKNQENFFPLYAWGNFCFIFSMWGLFYYVFLIIVIALRGGGGNSRQLSPLNKIRYLHGRHFAAFSLPFLHVRAFLLRFSHYNFAPAEGGRASLGVRLSLKNEERNMFCYMRGLFATFFSMWIFLPRC